MIKRILNILIISLLLFTQFIYPLNVLASSDFEIISDFTLKYSGESDVLVDDFVTFKVNNEKYYLQSGVVQTFFLNDYSSKDVKAEREYKLKTLKVQDDSSVPLKYTKKEEKEGISISVKVNRRINPYEDYTIELSYRTHDLINKSGNITNMYVPGLPSNTQNITKGDFGLTTEYIYNTNIITPSTYILPSYTQPSNISYSDKNGSRLYTLKKEDRIGKVGWLQFGNSQFYKFKLVQNATKTDNITPKAISDIAPIVSTNVYKIAIPRNYDENNQKVEITNINPKPQRIEQDFDGNLIAIFDVPANEDTKIEIEGIISLSLDDITTKEQVKDLNLATYFEELESFNQKDIYISEGKYWEISDSNIQNIAKTLYNKSSSILELVKNNYEYVVNTFEYSDEKLNQGNTRIGAKKALDGGATICMEYSDALTAIFRAQGIPARVAIGYGNDPLSKENNISTTSLNKQLIGHQWTQVWIPGYGWMSLDPTWGESQRTYIGSDLDHILWYTQSQSQQNITDVIFYSAQLGEIGDHEVYLQALDKQSSEQESQNSINLANYITEQNGSTDDINLFIKTSLAGRILVYLLPLFVAILISSIITSIIYTLKNRLSKSKYTKETDQVHP